MMPRCTAVEDAVATGRKLPGSRLCDSRYYHLELLSSVDVIIVIFFFLQEPMIHLEESSAAVGVASGSSLRIPPPPILSYEAAARAPTTGPPAHQVCSCLSLYFSI